MLMRLSLLIPVVLVLSHAFVLLASLAFFGGGILESRLSKKLDIQKERGGS